MFSSVFNLKKALCLIALFLMVASVSNVMLVSAAPSLTLNPTSGPPGTVVTVTGSGFTPSGQINADLWNGTSAYTFTADENGNLNTTETVPPVDVGTYQFVVTDAATQSSTQTQFTVTQSSTSPTPTTTPSTSSTPTATSSVSPTPTPTVPELPILAVAAVMALLLLGAVLLTVKKTR